MKNHETQNAPGRMFITGATSGFGEAVARMAAKAGYALALTGRRADRLEALQAELGDAVQHVLCFDVRDREGTAEAIQRCSADFIPTVLVNNAGWPWGASPSTRASTTIGTE